jgi:hypothetical protein
VALSIHRRFQGEDSEAQSELLLSLWAGRDTKKAPYSILGAGWLVL